MITYLSTPRRIIWIHSSLKGNLIGKPLIAQSWFMFLTISLYKYQNNKTKHQRGLLFGFKVEVTGLCSNISYKNILDRWRVFLISNNGWSLDYTSDRWRVIRITDGHQKHSLDRWRVILLPKIRMVTKIFMH